MRFISAVSVKSACLALGLSALTCVASATEINMHVPVTAKWGKQILPAGDYKLTVKANNPFAVVSGNGKRVTVSVVSSSQDTTNTESYVKIIDVNGTPTVEALASSANGMLYEFALPKGVSRVRN